MYREADGEKSCLRCWNHTGPPCLSRDNYESDLIQPDPAVAEEPSADANNPNRAATDAPSDDGTGTHCSEQDFAALQERAFEDAAKNVPPAEATGGADTPSTTPEYTRSSAIRRYVKARADGVCEGCGSPAPFTSKTGEPYLHAHHVHELSDGGADTPDLVIALCLNRHYRVHHGEDGEEYNQKLYRIVQEIESAPA